MQFIVADSFWELFPAAQIGVVLAEDLDNAAVPAGLEALCAEAWAGCAAALAGTADIAAHPAVAPWRAAYAQFGAKPSKFRSSIESLLRAAQAGRFRPINPLVDLYNAVSLRHRLPCGGEDCAALAGAVRLTRAQGGEPFRTIGANEEQPPWAGEVIYADDLGAICRCWNWREADRTKLTPATRAALLVVEALPAHDPAQLEQALGDLAALIPAYLGGRTRTALLTRVAPVFRGSSSK